MDRHACGRIDCDQDGEYVPRLNVPLAGIQTERDQPFVALIDSMWLCLKHCKEVRVEHLPGLKEMFSQKIGGGAVDWKRAYFTPVKIDSEEYKVLSK